MYLNRSERRGPRERRDRAHVGKDEALKDATTRCFRDREGGG